MNDSRGKKNDLEGDETGKTGKTGKTGQNRRQEGRRKVKKADSFSYIHTCQQATPRFKDISGQKERILCIFYSMENPCIPRQTVLTLGELLACDGSHRWHGLFTENTTERTSGRRLLNGIPSDYC